MKSIIRIIIAALLLTATVVGVGAISRQHNIDGLHRIQLKDTQLKEKTLEMRYDKALKDLDTTTKDKSSTQQQLQDAQQKLQDLEKQKQDLEQQLQAKKDAQNTLASRVQVPLTATAYAAPAAPSVVGGCGDNSYANYIYMHESGCNLNAVNAGGCRGIGQACPGSKLPCGADYACQNAYFTNYANSRYGGWAGAYSFWLANHWW